MIDIKTIRSFTTAPCYLYPFLNAIKEKSQYQKQKRDEVTCLLEELQKILAEHENDVASQWYKVVQAASEVMDQEEWCYLCELLITELKGDLPYPDIWYP